MRTIRFHGRSVQLMVCALVLLALCLGLLLRTYTRSPVSAKRRRLSKHPPPPPPLPLNVNERSIDDVPSAPPPSVRPVEPLRAAGHRRRLKPSPSTAAVEFARSAAPYPQLQDGNFIPRHRIVHIDLKGAAPQAYYFKPFFSLIRRLGATGILIEWEDMFPYTGKLAAVKNGNAYSVETVRQILGWAQEFGLDIIPLVQTFGHLEWILKLPQFAHLRQVDRYPQVICLGNKEAVDLVKEALDQVLAVHKDFHMPYFHMGADEAFQVGMCAADQALMEKELDGSRERLMLRHLSLIAAHIRQRRPETRVMMWHDMLNNLESDMLKEFRLGLIDPVVWNYAEKLDEQLYPEMWQKFAEVFPYIWGASAYKGADGPDRYYSNVPHYLENHLSWLSQMTSNYRQFKEFRGIILTGWQRFDHLAVLCETLPVGVPSLAVNLATLARGRYDLSARKVVTRALDCSSTVDIDAPLVGQCRFPGAGVYEQVQQLRVALEEVERDVHQDYQVHGWLSRFNARHNYSNAWYIDQIVDKVNMHLSELRASEEAIRTEMSKVFFEDTVEEFVFEYVRPAIERLQRLLADADAILKHSAFPVRPFPIDGVVQKKSAKKPKLKQSQSDP